MINNYRILANEDDALMRDIFSFYLADFKDVVIVDSGEEAIKECRTNLFDLVLTDIKSPHRMNGIEALKEIRKIDGYRNIPILAVTGYTMNGDKEYFIQEGFNGYLAKPFLKATFLEFISKFLPAR